MKVAIGPEPPRKTPRPILVTGSHRSGTTWVGRLVALAPNVHYIHEPFNPVHGHVICGARFNRWFMHVCKENESRYYRRLKRTMEFRFSVTRKILQAKTPLVLPQLLRQWRHSARCRQRRLRPLVKDPIALFSAPWLASRFEMDVVVMIRHPAAFASSLKIANWNFPFEDWMKQPLLLEDLLAPFASEIEQHARQRREVIDQAALLWKCMHHVISRYQAAHPDWIFIKHEDLSLSPLEGFQTIYQRLDLPFSEDIRAAIVEHSAPANPVGAVQRRHDIKLNSRANIGTWRKRLSSEESLRIRTQVEPVASYFYPEESWAPSPVS